MSRTALSLLALGLVACGPSTSDKAPVLDIGGLQGGMPGGGTIGAVFTTPGVKPGEELDPYVDENFITLISAAKSSVKLAVDRLDHPAMQEAVLEAWDRGLDVQVVGDSKNALDDGFQLLESAGVPVVIRPADVGVMNNKYAVVDDFVVWTGSLSPVTSDLLYNNNANIYLADEALASLYANDFKQMFVGQTFGGGKEQLAAGTAVNVGGAYGQVAFGGADPQLDVIIAEIESATSSIVIAARVLEHAGIVNALLQARASGIAVVVLLDYTAAESSLVWEEALLDGDIIVVRDGNENTMGDAGGSMGHQFMLIDGMEGSAGSSLIVSSGPWAQSGAETDDNNLLLLRDADIADRYAAELCDLLTAARPHPTRTGAPTPVDALRRLQRSGADGAHQRGHGRSHRHRRRQGIHRDRQHRLHSGRSQRLDPRRRRQPRPPHLRRHRAGGRRRGGGLRPRQPHGRAPGDERLDPGVGSQQQR